MDWTEIRRKENANRIVLLSPSWSSHLLSDLMVTDLPLQGSFFIWDIPCAVQSEVHLVTSLLPHYPSEKKGVGLFIKLIILFSLLAIWHTTRPEFRLKHVLKRLYPTHIFPFSCTKNKQKKTNRGNIQSSLMFMSCHISLYSTW